LRKKLKFNLDIDVPVYSRRQIPLLKQRHSPWFARQWSVGGRGSRRENTCGTVWRGLSGDTRVESRTDAHTGGATSGPPEPMCPT